LKIPEAENEEQYTYFSTSCISMLLRGTAGKAVHMVLTGALIQKGFSGGPVFEEKEI